MKNQKSAFDDFYKAKEIYSSEHNNIGLANVLLCCGDLHKQINDSKKAREAYDEAKKLYILEHYHQGLLDLILRKNETMSINSNINKTHQEMSYLNIQELNTLEAGNTLTLQLYEETIKNKILNL